MRYLISGLLLLLGMLLFFMLITACAPGRTMTRDSAASEKAVTVSGSQAEEVDFNFDEDEPVETFPKNMSKKLAKNADSTSRSKLSANRNAEEEIDEGSDEQFSQQNERFYQKGEASWYGRAFHGKKTASGEKFDMYDYTAAHRTLPFGTILTVKNLENNKTVKVRINDRGPYREGRILDLSYAAARKLDMLSSGTALVGINILKKGAGESSFRQKFNDVEPAAGDEADFDTEIDRDNSLRGRLALQVGAFYSKGNAHRLKSKIEGLIDRPVIIHRDGEMYKVRILSIASKKELERIRETLNAENIPNFTVRNLQE
ncbi:MAG: septal ring lytic transglycosylase RlpA family protein [Spirochaetes bacterium]|nr:septal ring lytic transglycosylase RlpA family protein [Spirochaetota bacterium]